MFSLYSVDLCENHTKMRPPPTSPLPLHLGRIPENVKNLILHFQMINNFNQQGCSSKYLEGNPEEIFEIDAYLLIFNDFYALSHYGAMFHALYFRNGCIDLHV